MTKRGSLFPVYAFTTENLSSHVHVVVMKLGHVDLVKSIAKIRRCDSLLITVRSILCCIEVFDHLERRHESPIVVLLSSVRQSQN